MKLFFTLFSLLLFVFFSTQAVAQYEMEIETYELIEVQGDEGMILVFPSPIQGPHGPVIKFVIFGAEATPEVIVDTPTGSISPHITTIHFTENERFSGWFEAPEEEILSIWIHGFFIPWENTQ